MITITRRRVTTFVAVAMVIGGAGAYAASKDQPPPPPLPAGEAPSGAVDVSQMPDELEVVGANGKPIVCPDGKKLKVEKKELAEAPPEPGSPGWQAAQSRGNSEPTVFRCGPHDKAVRVPASWVR